MPDLVRLIPFKVRVITGREEGERENAALEPGEPHLYPTNWADRTRRIPSGKPGHWPEDHLFSGKVGTVVGCADGFSHTVYLVCFPGEMPVWISAGWLQVLGEGEIGA